MSRQRILTILEDDKRIIVDSQYCRVGSVYLNPYNETIKSENYEKRN